MQTFSVGNVISATFGVYLRNFVFFTFLAILICAIAIVGVIVFVGLVSQTSVSEIIDLGEAAVMREDLDAAVWFFGISLGYFVFYMLGMMALNAVCCAGVVEDLSPDGLRFLSSMSRGVSAVPRAVFVGLLMAVAIVIAYMMTVFVLAFMLYLFVSAVGDLGVFAGVIILPLMFVPVVLLWLRWYVCLQVAVVERTDPLTAMSRSRFLTDGHRWSIVAIWLVLSAISFGLSMLVSIVAGVFFGLAGTGVAGPVAFILGVVSFIGLFILPTIVFAIGTAQIYVQLSADKDDVSADRLAEVF